MTASRGEGAGHRELKRRAWLWAQSHGFGACGLEIRVPRSGFRADVVACAIPRLGDAVGEVAIFECKHSRGDLLRDTADERATSERLREVHARRTMLERMLGLHLPDLRRGTSLFPEYDDYELDAIRHTGLRRVRREEARLQARLHGATKFDRLRRYGSADRLYLVVAAGVLKTHETPLGWGLLEDAGEGLEVRRLPERIPVQPEARLALLQALAISATRRAGLELGLDWEAVEAARRGLPGTGPAATPELA